MADETLYINTTRRRFVLSDSSAQPVVQLRMIQAEELSVDVIFLAESGNGLVPFTYVDPTTYGCVFGLGVLDGTLAKNLLAYANTFTNLGDGTAGNPKRKNFVLNLATQAAAAFLKSVSSLQATAELQWDDGTPLTTAVKASVPALVVSTFIDIGLTPPT